jgi:hypothetical protein
METIDFPLVVSEFHPNLWWESLILMVTPLLAYLICLNVVEVGLSAMGVIPWPS